MAAPAELAPVAAFVPGRQVAQVASLSFPLLGCQVVAAVRALEQAAGVAPAYGFARRLPARAPRRPEAGVQESPPFEDLKTPTGVPAKTVVYGVPGRRLAREHRR